MSRKILFWALTFLVLVFAVFMLLVLLEDELSPSLLSNKAISIGYLFAGSYTIIVGLLLRPWLTRGLEKIPSKVLQFTIIGSVGAAFVETVIWLAQTLLQTTGAAISPNIFVDLIMTMPFYILLTYLFAKLISRYRFSWKVVALSGGIYEITADGVVGNLFQGNIFGALVSPLLLPAFIVVYSPIILVPFLLLSKDFRPSRDLTGVGFLRILHPALAVVILPFSIILGVFLEKTIIK